MKTTRYFEEQVLARRPYVRREWCAWAIARPMKRVTQTDGRVRCWIAVRLPGDAQDRYLRVVLLEDGETVHKAFLDRDFAEARS